LFDLARFDLELVRIIDVLISAAAATAEIRAARLNAVRRRFENFEQSRFRELFFLAHDPRRDALATDRERNENGLALMSRDSAAAKRNLVDLKFDLRRQYWRVY
jgi:hypothetical protein